ncbi:MAG: type VII secretion protein EccC, partial [Micromonosporaceae bacterium]|nr:type VII secretion protein EccC [Micromonosporaceae bacterium]
MTTRLIHRPARAMCPSPPAGPVTVEPPPLLPEGKAISGIQSLIPMAGAGAAMSMMMFLRGSGFAALGAVIIVVSLTAAGVFYLSQRGRATRQRRSHRERYLDHLERVRERLRGEEQELRGQAHRLDPPVTGLLDIVRDPARRWERRRLDSDFLRVRVGVGELPARELQLSDQGTLTNPTDPFMRQEAQALVRRFELVPGLPLCLPLDQAGSVSVIGERAEVLRIARAIIAQIAALHAPDDVTIAVVARPGMAADWTWARWLPHLLPPGQIGPAGPTPLLVECPADLCAMLSDDLDRRAAEAASCLRRPSDHPAARVRARLVVIDDAYRTVARELPLPGSWGSPQALGITLVHLLADRLDEPGEVSCRVTVEAGSVTVVDPRDTPSREVTGT